MNDTLLLATFCKARDVKDIINLINDSFEIVGGKIFVLQDESDRHKKILTYNIVKEDIVFSDVIKNTISLNKIKKIILKIGVKKIDYIKILDINKLIKPYRKEKKFKIFIAYYLKSTRLIDNV